MNMMKLLVIAGLILLQISSVAAYGLSADAYLNEFDEPGETCIADNYFNYWIPKPKFLNSNNYQLTVPVIYRCCTGNNECTSVTFDLQNQEFLADSYVAEILNLDYIKKNIENGTISDKAYLLDSSFDVCSFFGTNKLQQEALNLGGEAAKEAKPLLSSRNKQIVTESLTAAKSIGIIKKLNPTDLVVSATCYINQKSLKQAMEKLTECNGYLHNIKNRRVIAGQANLLRNCDAEAKQILAEYVDSDTSKVRCAVNKLGNAITGAISYVKSIGETNPPANDIKIAESECELAQKAINQLNEQELHFDNPETAAILAKYRQRIQEKQATTETGLAASIANYQKVKDLLPGIPRLYLTNLFYEPDYNVSLAQNLIARAGKVLVEGNSNLKEYKYNSATAAFAEMSPLLTLAEEELTRERATKRTFDRRWLIALLLIPILFLLRKRIISAYNQA